LVVIVKKSAEMNVLEIFYIICFDPNDVSCLSTPPLVKSYICLYSTYLMAEIFGNNNKNNSSKYYLAGKLDLDFFSSQNKFLYLLSALSLGSRSKLHSLEVPSRFHDLCLIYESHPEKNIILTEHLIVEAIFD